MFLLTLFETKKTKQQRSHLKNLIALAKADGVISADELKFIHKIAGKNGLKAAEVEELIKEASEEKLYLPSNDSARFDQIFELVQLMLADGNIEDPEMDFCIKMAEKLGFRKPIVGVLVRKISIGLTAGLDKDSIKKESENFLDF